MSNAQHSWPVGIFVPSARRLVAEISEAAQTPEDLSAQMILGISAGLCSRSVDVQWQNGTSEPTNLYLITALAPSERKSTVVKILLPALMELEEERRTEMGREIARWHEKKKLLEETIKTTRTQVAKGSATETELLQLAERLHEHLESEPVEPRYRVDDITQEELNRILANQPVAMISSEGNLIDNIGGRYSQNGEGSYSTYLKAWSGDSISEDRVSRGNQTVLDPALTISITCQPASLVKMASIAGARSSGLLSRFLFSVPESRVGSRRVGTDGVSEQARDQWRATVRRLAELPQCTLILDDQARRILFAFAECIETRMRPGGDLRRLADWAGKVEVGQVVRIAGVLHCMEYLDPSKRPISAETMQRAMALASYYISEAKRAFHDMASPYASAAVRVGRWLKEEKLKEVTPRLVARKFGVKTEDANGILQELESEGRVSRRDAKTFRVEDVADDEQATEPMPSYSRPEEPVAGDASPLPLTPPTMTVSTLPVQVQQAQPMTSETRYLDDEASNTTIIFRTRRNADLLDDYEEQEARFAALTYPDDGWDF